MPTYPEFQSWAESVSLWQVIGWSAGVIGLVAFGVWFKRKGWPWLLAFARAIIKTAQVVDAIQGLPEFIARTDKQIGEIHHEVHYNNGSSVKDAQRRTENAVERIELGVKGLYDVVDELKASDVALRDVLDERTQPKPIQE